VLSEFGVDSIREGAEARRDSLAKVVVKLLGSGRNSSLSWTDEWFTGGFAIQDWVLA